MAKGSQRASQPESWGNGIQKEMTAANAKALTQKCEQCFEET